MEEFKTLKEVRSELFTPDEIAGSDFRVSHMFVTRLNNVKDSYYSFVVAVMTYVKNKPSRLPIVEKFMDEHPDATTSDILEFISNQPDFYEDADYYKQE